MAAPKQKSNVITAIVYDFETGGTDCTKCAATQISLHAVRLDTFEVMDKYNSYIYPYFMKPDIGQPKRKVLKSKYDTEEQELMEYSERASAVSGITMDMLYSMGKPLEDVCDEICEFIENNTFEVVTSNKPFFIGQNPQFDSGFMQQIMLYTDRWGKFIKLVRGNKDFWGNFQMAQLDTIILNQLTFDDDPSIETWKLEAMAERLGIDMDDAHDADADVVATREITRTLTGRMRSKGGTIINELAEEKREKLRDHFKI